MLDYSIEFNKADFGAVIDADFLIPVEEEKPLSPSKAVRAICGQSVFLVTFSRSADNIGTMGPENFLNSFKLPWGE